MAKPLLLDTCAAIWLSEAQSLGQEATTALEEAYDIGSSVYISPITAWEVGLLVSRGRLSIMISPRVWFRRLADVLNFRVADMSPEVLIASSFLPGAPPRDPADRIMAATARECGYVLITRDRPLLDYAAQGHLQAFAC